MPRRAILALPAVGAVLVALVAWLALGRSGGESRAAPARAGATATVERRHLVESETVDGTLGYAGRQAVVNRLPGTITRLPREGATVRRNGTLLEVDGRPVVLMYGSVPAWRRLAVGVPDGPDVAQLERNLAALGYSPGTVDDRYDADTAAAVRGWQADLELPRTGAVELGRVAFLPGPRRIRAVKATLGSAGGGMAAEALETTSTRRVVSVQLDADKQQLAVKGKRAEVELPDGRVVSGRVASVGRVARQSGGGEDEGPGGGGEDTAQVTVTIRLTGRVPSRVDEAPVAVSLARETRRGALSVPVAALQGAPGGGYVVQLVGAEGATRPLRVRPGLFADGYVAVSGRGLREGMRVAVPSQ